MKKFILLFFILSLLFFSRNLLSGKVYLPLDILDRGHLYPPKGNSLRNLMIGDAIVIFYPSDFIYNEYLKKGEILKWNPYIFSGYPEFESGQSATFHPVRLILHYFFDPFTAHDIGLFIHLFLCCIFTFIYLRNLGLSEFSSAFGGIVWAFSFSQMTWFEMERTVYTGAYIPLTLYLYDRAKNGNPVFYSILGGISLSLLLLTRHLQWALYGYLMLFFYFIFHIIEIYTKEKKLSSFLIPFIPFFLISIFGFLLSSIQLIPTFELIKHSSLQRPGGNILASYFSISTIKTLPVNLFYSLLTFLNPNLLGSPIDVINLYPYANFVEYQGYIGLLPLICVILSISMKKDKNVIFYLSVFLLTFLMSLGTFLNLPFDILIPGFSRLPHHRIIYLTSFCGAVLSSYGFELLYKKALPSSLLKKVLFLFWILWIGYTFIIFLEYRKSLPYDWISLKNPVIHLPILILITSHLLIYLRNKMGNNPFAVFSLFLISMDLLPLGFNFNTCADRKYADLRYSYIQKIIGEEKEFFRIIGVEPNWTALLKKFTPEGYQSLYPDFYFKAISENSPYARHQLKVLGDMLSKTMIRLLNVKYIYLNPWSDAKVEEGATLIHSKLARIYRINDYIPRVFFITNVQKADESWIISALRNNEFNPKEILYLSEEFPEVPPLNSESKTEIKHYSPHKISIDVSSEADGFLVLSDAYYPGWKCYVDGKEEKIYKAYAFLRAVYIKKGRHRVEFIYAPFSYKIGKIITITTLIISAVILLIFYRKPEKKSEHQDKYKNEKTNSMLIIIPTILLLIILILTLRWIKLTSEFAKSRWYGQIAYIFEKHGDRDTALEYLKKGVSFKKTAYEAHEGLGLIYNAEKKFAEALEQFEKAVRIIPNPRGYINSAVLKTKLRKYNEALSDLKKALELDPKNSDAYFGMSVVYDLIGEKSKAEKYRRMAEELK
jgi:tetratricopeptide (TPR) repeat protein